MRRLTVLYDPQCGLCRRVHEWMLAQPKHVEVVFVPVNSEEAWHRYPQLNHTRTVRELTVIDDRGAVYWDAKAYLMCLWALKQYRGWSFRLSAPELLPTTRRVLSMISQNRYRLQGLGRALPKRAS